MSTLPTAPLPTAPKLPASRPAVAGVRRSALIELAVFFAAALAWDAAFGDGTRFDGASPHPFWIPVLLMAVFYGLREGVVAAVVACLALRVANVPAQSIDQQVYEYAWSLAREPVLWTVVAVVLGEIRQQQARAHQALAADLSGVQARNEELIAAYRDLDATRDRLETRLVGQASTAVQLYQAVQAADRLDADGVLDTSADLVRAALQPEAFSIFLLQGETLQQVHQEGPVGDQPGPHAYRAGSALFDHVVARRRTLCVAYEADEAVLGTDGLLAGPLVDSRTGQVFGMLKVERLRFLDFSFSTLQAFRVLCEWVATAYANAQRYQAARAGQVVNQETQLYSMSFLERQAQYLTFMAQRFKFDLTMLVLRVEDLGELAAEEQVAVSVALSDTARTVLRRTDLAFEYRRDVGEFAVLMPGTPLERVHIVGEKLLSALNQRLEHPLRTSLHIKPVFTLAPDGGARIAPGTPDSAPPSWSDGDEAGAEVA